MNDALSRLIQKTRPYTKFTVDIEGSEPETFQVRRTSVADNERLARSFNEAYDTKMRDLVESGDTVDASVLRRSLHRQKKESLVKYIVDSNERDLENEVLDLYDGDPSITRESPEVKERVAEEKAKMSASLSEKTSEELIESALDRRGHFIAFVHAQQARLRTLAALTIFKDDGTPLFDTVEQVGELDETLLENILSAATNALAPKKDEELADPLK